MTTTSLLPCDGCGQPASPDHFARRLQRLEWSTRYRPVHIQTLLLSAVAPAQTINFLYAEAVHPEGESAQLLDALQIPWEGKSPETFLTDFQKRGLFLIHFLECPLDPANLSPAATQALLEKHLPLAVARIRRSLKPKRVALISSELQPLVGKLTESSLGCPVLLHLDKPFEIWKKEGTPEIVAFRQALEVARAGAV
jgi:hypothetical protein